MRDLNFRWRGPPTCAHDSTTLFPRLLCLLDVLSRYSRGQNIPDHASARRKPSLRSPEGKTPAVKTDLARMRALAYSHARKLCRFRQPSSDYMSATLRVIQVRRPLCMGPVCWSIATRNCRFDVCCFLPNCI